MHTKVISNKNKCFCWRCKNEVKHKLYKTSGLCFECFERNKSLTKENLLERIQKIEEKLNMDKEELWTEIAKTKDIEKLIRETGRWRREKKFKTSWNNFAEKLMLIITELAESDEAFLKPSTDSNSGTHTDYDNLAEEWIDVAVRTSDLIEACGLVSVLPSNIEIITEREIEKLYFFAGKEYYSKYFQEQDLALNRKICWNCTLYLSSIMEQFRDIELVDERPVQNKKSAHAIKMIVSNLALIIEESFYVLDALGESWWDKYAEKMIKNEQRPVLHGRKR